MLLRSTIFSDILDDINDQIWRDLFNDKPLQMSCFYTQRFGHQCCCKCHQSKQLLWFLLTFCTTLTALTKFLDIFNDQPLQMSSFLYRQHLVISVIENIDKNVAKVCNFCVCVFNDILQIITT